LIVYLLYFAAYIFGITALALCGVRTANCMTKSLQFALETRANKPGSERRSAMALRPVFKAGIGRLRRLIGSWAAAPGSPWSAEKGLSTGGSPRTTENVCVLGLFASAVRSAIGSNSGMA